MEHANALHVANLMGIFQNSHFQTDVFIVIINDIDSVVRYSSNCIHLIWKKNQVRKN